MRLYHMDLKVAMLRTSFIKSWMERISRAGFGGILVEVDNKIVYPSHPDLAASDALTPEEWHSLAFYARELGLEFYPLIQSLGHMEHVLVPGSRYELLAETPGNRYLMCPRKPGTAILVKELARDVWEAFGKPDRIHFGGDETRGTGSCPRCHGTSDTDLLSEYLLKLADWAMEKGIQPEFWADMILANPDMLERFPSGISLIDWDYYRRERYTEKKMCRGVPDADNVWVEELPDRIPDRMKMLLPYLSTPDGLFNNFYGTEFLLDRGYEVTVGSAVRSHGDSCHLPRTESKIRNVGVSDTASRELNCRHLVTSWAVRLPHPETTWPALIATDPTQADRPWEVGGRLGGLSRDLLSDIARTEISVPSLDRPNEPNMRFERPYYDGLDFLKMATGNDSDELIETLEARKVSGTRVEAVFRARREQNEGEREVVMHWQMGVKLLVLKSDCALEMISSYQNGLNPKRLRVLIERYRSLMDEFTKLWSESHTEEALVLEREVKFHRDIRILEATLSETI